MYTIPENTYPFSPVYLKSGGEPDRGTVTQSFITPQVIKLKEKYCVACRIYIRFNIN